MQFERHVCMVNEYNKFQSHKTLPFPYCANGTVFRRTLKSIKFHNFVVLPEINKTLCS